MKPARTLLVGLALLLFGAKTTHAANVVINEIFANPVNEDEEFVELYNLSEATIDLKGWQISDLVKTYTITEASISAKSFLVFKKDVTKITLNNDVETVNLKDNSNELIDSFSYDGTKEGKSHSRINDGENNWLAETEISENSNNIAPPSPSSSPSTSPNPSLSPSPATSASPSPSLAPSPSSRPSPSQSASPQPSPEENLATASATTATPEATPAVLGQKTTKNYLLAYILIGSGAILLATTAIVFYNQTHAAKT